jgi:hypothetical protein
MKLIKYFLLVFSSCSMFASEEIEIIRGMMPTDTSITFNVDSNGCTIKEDFMVMVTKKGDRTVLFLKRIHEDLCRGYMPMGTKISFTYEELNMPEGEFMVANPVIGYWTYYDFIF